MPEHFHLLVSEPEKDDLELLDDSDICTLAQVSVQRTDANLGHPELSMCGASANTWRSCDTSIETR